MSENRIGALYLTAGFILAGSATTAGKGLSETLGPFSVTAAGLAFAMPALLPFLLRGPLPSRKELAATALLGFFGIFVYRFCLVSALSLVDAGEAGLMTGAAPALTAVASWLFLRERVKLRSVVGVAAASAGIFLVRFGASAPAAGSAVESAGRSVGLALALGAAASEAIFAVLSRSAFRGSGAASGSATAAGTATAAAAAATDPRRRTALTAVWALAFSVGPAAAEHPVAALAALPLASWAALAWYGLFVTAASYICWYEGIRRVPASRAAAYTGIVPVVALVLPALVLGERPAWTSVAGCVLVAAGIAIGELPRKAPARGAATSADGDPAFRAGLQALRHGRLLDDRAPQGADRIP